MSSQLSHSSAVPERTTEEPYIPVEEIARRLDLPLTILLRRIEAGDVPARRVLGTGGSGWGIRLSDLGIESDRAERDSDAPSGAPAYDDREPERPVEAAAESTAAEPAPAMQEPVAAEAAAAAAPSPAPEPYEPGSSDPMTSDSLPGDPATPESFSPDEAAAAGAAADESSFNQFAPDPYESVAMLSGRITRYDRGTRGPRREVAGMFIDSRELVGGLLDRWERTLEQRIFIEQRQRFEAELNARQNLVKQLQLELQTARAEHAAYVADIERRHLELKHQITELQREQAAAAAPMYDVPARRRGLFHRR